MSPTSSSRAGFVSGLALVVALSVLAWLITQYVYGLKLPFGIPGKSLEYPLWAVLIGLAGNVILKRLRAHDFIRPGLRTELFLKTGLVLLGAGLSFRDLLQSGGGAVTQALLLIPAVFFFCWWLAGRFGLDDKLRAVMSTAIAVCGVSAAIAAAGSVLARKEQVTYVTTLVIVVALPLMVVMPWAASALGLSPTVAGAWFGGNIDTTAAVIGAGTIYGEAAQKIAAVVKTTQNALIGVVTFLLAFYFATVVEGQSGRRPSPRLIWERFPKFVLGFVLASVLFSLGWIGKDAAATLGALKNWAFTLAFVSMGLELSAREVRQMGWRPVLVFLLTTLFNTLLALGLAWLFFGWLTPGG